jgi:hypothetical protein
VPKRIRDKAKAREYTRKYRERNKEKVRARARELYWQNPEKYRAKRKMERRRHPEREREKRRIQYLKEAPWSAADTEYQRQYRKKNADRLREYQKEYRKKNRDRVNARTRAYVKANRERANVYQRRMFHIRKRTPAQGNFTTADVDALIKRQKGKCYWCKRPYGEYHIDHVWPLSKGGSNCASNIVISCVPCNRTKKAKTPMEWAGRLL